MKRLEKAGNGLRLREIGFNAAGKRWISGEIMKTARGAKRGGLGAAGATAGERLKMRVQGVKQALKRRR